MTTLKKLSLLDTIFPILLFISEFPEKPKSIKYLFNKYPFLKWIIVFIFFYNKGESFMYTFLLFTIYTILYNLDTKLEQNCDDFKKYT